HTPVESRPIQGISCRFRTTSEVEILPLQLNRLDYSVKGEGALLSLRMAMVCEGCVGDLGLQRLRLHLAGERYVSQMLYLYLLQRLERIERVLLDADGPPLALPEGSGRARALQGGADRMQAGGFASQQGLVPYPVITFAGYRCLQEYCAFEDKFLVVEVT